MNFPCQDELDDLEAELMNNRRLDFQTLEQTEKERVFYQQQMQESLAQGGDMAEIVNR